jgi:hypothetical protein
VDVREDNVAWSLSFQIATKPAHEQKCSPVGGAVAVQSDIQHELAIFG